MPEHIVLLTGHLARPRLEKVIAGLGGGEASFEIVDLGVKVAALATAELIARRLPRPLTADRVILPGRCRPISAGPGDRRTCRATTCASSRKSSRPPS